jgi:hypothetical protein
MNDNNNSTAWQAGDATFPQWVKVDLGSSKQIHYVTLRWTVLTTPGTDTVTYNIETSPNNSTWTSRFSGSNTVVTGSNQTWTADVPNHDARYVRVNITARSSGLRAGITELGIWGLAAGTSPPPPIPPGTPPPPSGPAVDAKFSIPNSAIFGITEDPPDNGHIPENAIDGNLSTRWSTANLPQGLEVDLGETKRIAFLKVAWYRGNERTCNYRIITHTVGSEAGVVRKTGTSSGQTTGFETYDFPDVNARWVEFWVDTNSQSNFASISELEIWGGDVLTSTPPPPGPPGPPPGPLPPPSPPSTPTPTGTLSMMLNFNNSINDDSGLQNHALMDGGTQRFAAGATSALGNSISLNPLPNQQASFTTAASTSLIKYYGGPVFNRYNAQVYNIFWGSEWNSTSVAPWFGGGNINAVTLRNTLTSAFSTITNSDYHKGLWQYGDIKPPIIGGNVVHTTTALPSGGDVSLTDVSNCINGAISAGQVPNPNSFGEPTAMNGQTGFGSLDYRHIYIVILPPSKRLLVGGARYSGYANRGRTSTSGVWYVYAGINLGSPTSDATTAQWAEQTWGHELIHDATNPAMVYNCSNISGYMCPDPSTGVCLALNHTLPGVENCHVSNRFKALPNTSVFVDYYWSDKDGDCIAPGTGDPWTPPPLGTPPPSPTPPPPSPPGVPPPSPSPSTETFEKLWVPFSNTIQIIHNTSPGFSVFCRIYPYTLTTTSAGAMRVLWIKQDDLNNGAHAILGPDGAVYFTVKKDNVRYKVRTDPGVISANAWHHLWFTFDKSTNSATIYANNIRYSTPSTVTEYWNNTHSHFIIGNSNTGSAGNPYRGRIDDFRLYRNGVVSQSSVQNMWDNQHTIEAIPVGDQYAVAIAGFVKLDEPLNNNTFVTANFDTTILPPSTPTPPPPPPGTDDAPPPPPTADEEEPEPVLCD